MSHYVTYVLVDQKKLEGSETDVENIVGELLSPYDENLSVPHYQRQCYCVGRAARLAAREAADKACGTIEELRKQFYAVGDDRNEDEVDKAWKAHIAPYNAVEDETFNSHPLKAAPNPKCEDCKGSGQETTTYNPKSKWDWWQIGGRWTGVLDGFDPASLPENNERCIFCEGTGTTTEGIAVKYPAYTSNIGKKCYQCDGKGTRLKFAGSWMRYKGDIAPVANIDLSDDMRIPFAIVTPDGEWHQKAEMGWFGMSRNENENWLIEAKKLLEEHKDAIAVVCDLHI